MNSYMEILLNVCFTMATGVVVVGCLGSMLFLSLMIWRLIDEHIK